LFSAAKAIHLHRVHVIGDGSFVLVGDAAQVGPDATRQTPRFRPQPPTQLENQYRPRVHACARRYCSTRARLRSGGARVNGLVHRRVETADQVVEIQVPACRWCTKRLSSAWWKEEGVQSTAAAAD
jgi:hypothetical protein